VTLSLSPERAVGGQLVPGDTVSVLASFDPFNVDYVEPGEAVDAGGIDGNGDPIFIGSTGDEDGPGLRTPNSTHLILHGVVVTNLQVERRPTAAENDADNADVPDLAPTGNLLVTLAVQPADAERIVFTAEHGFVWLAADDEDISVIDTSIQTRESIYR
jgi:pilus assembly protein CpaB